jgi:hypothetical protein
LYSLQRLEFDGQNARQGHFARYLRPNFLSYRLKKRVAKNKLKA